MLAEPGVRHGTFSNGAGKAALAPSGQGNLYALTVTTPVQIGFVSGDTITTTDDATPVRGVIGFGVDHPERVDAITIVQDGREIARAPLT